MLETQTGAPPVPVAARWYDQPARHLARRLPRLGARLVIRAHRHLVGDRLTAINVGGVRMAVSPQDNFGHSLFYYGAYEPHQGQLWERLLGRGDRLTVLDVGANLGYYSLIAASRPTVARVVAFEPNPLVLPVLRYNATVNPALAPKLMLAEVAVGDREGTVPFHRNFAEHNFGLGSLRSQTDDATTVPVPLVRLDRYLPALGIDHVDLAKIDVEGAERGVLEGLLSWCRPTLVVETHPDLLKEFDSSASEVLTLLRDGGYRLQRLTPNGQLVEPGTFREVSWILAE
jgi:FkbM family methyltransferase